MDCSPRPYLTVRALPRAAQPCHVSRRGDAVLVQVQPGTPVLTLLAYMADNLTDAEQNAYRAVCDMGPVGTPLPDELLDIDVHNVDEALRLDCERDAYPDWTRPEPAHRTA